LQVIETGCRCSALFCCLKVCLDRCTAGYGFGFFKDADSNVAPSPDLSAAVFASDRAVIGRIFWDDESIAATLGASEGGVRHGACRPFWLAIANRQHGLHDYAPERTEVKPCAEAVRSLAFASTLAEMPRWARQLAGPRSYAMKNWDEASLGPLLRRRGHKTESWTLKLATVAENVATTCLDGVARNSTW
jgi:hypothetical protein